MAAYYNENDPNAAAWLRELIKQGHIAFGEVDERSIEDVRPDELAGFTQCHFFAGIGGWSYALRLAGWPDDQPVWTGSCPCQPFSVIGKHGGAADKRHLWPDFCRLINQRRPSVVFGEQVASKAGRAWLTGVRSDLEGMGYAVGAADLCAASVNAPHRRQRIYWVADSGIERLERFAGDGDHCEEQGRIDTQSCGSATEAGAARNEPASVDALPMLRGLDLHDPRRACSGLRLPFDRRMGERSIWDRFWACPCADGWRRIEPGLEPLAHGFSENLANVLSCCDQAWQQVIDYGERTETDPSEILRVVRDFVYQEACREKQSTGVRSEFSSQAVLFSLLLSIEATRDRTTNICGSKKKGAAFIARAVRGLWLDGGDVCSSHRRQSEEQCPGQFADAVRELPLILARTAQAYREATESAHASLGRVGLLRGYGNAIVPQVAAAFIEAAIK